MRAGNQWKVMLSVNTENPDPHGQRVTSYLALAEGDKRTVGLDTKQAVVELVRIYADQEKIDIINLGTPMTLSMKEDGFESPTRPQDPSHPRLVTPEIRKALQAANPPKNAPKGPPSKIPGLVEAGVPGAVTAPVDAENSRRGGSMPVDGVPPTGVATSVDRGASGNPISIKIGGAEGTSR
jgi:hypothetical protein